jgi:hypothetical protein
MLERRQAQLLQQLLDDDAHARLNPKLARMCYTSLVRLRAQGTVTRTTDSKLMGKWDASEC